MTDKLPYHHPPRRNQRSNRIAVIEIFERAGIDPNDIGEIGVNPSVVSHEGMPIELSDDSQAAGSFDPSEFGEGIYYSAVAPDRAMDTWRLLRRDAFESGLYPILYAGHSKSDLPDWLPFLARDPREGLQAGISYNIEQRVAEVEGRHRDDGLKYHGAWPDQPQVCHQSVFIHGYSDDIDMVPAIALLPGRNGWEALSNFQLGGNQPSAAEFIAFTKYWHAQHGAEVLGLWSDRMELYVETPPTNRDIALDVAREMIAFCWTMLDQELPDGRLMTSVQDVAASAINSTIWRFFWD